MKKILLIVIPSVLVSVLLTSAVWVFASKTESDPSSQNTSSSSNSNSAQNQTNQTSGPTNQSSTTQPSSQDDSSSLQECLDIVNRREANETLLQEARDSCYKKFQ